MNTLALIALPGSGRNTDFWTGLSYLMVLGFMGMLFSRCASSSNGSRQSDRAKALSQSRSGLSIAGSVLMCIYFIFRRDPVGILAYLPNSLIYIRNLMLIRKRKFAFTAAAPSQHPREQSGSEPQPSNNSLDAILWKLRPHAETINIFCDTVERLAEEKMLKTHKLEGAHYSAMKQLREKIIGATSKA
ncbi:MAG: hypothetical protein Udaeo2_27160 [Candidatus Udaeobacter sp.]|nr:MAG: hypothetical protein Udaeo2_27160 [Candidatus Udaeobacter sp.]